MTIKETVAKYVPLNFALLANPINWVIVALVVALAGVGLAAILIPNASSAKDTQ